MKCVIYRSSDVLAKRHARARGVSIVELMISVALLSTAGILMSNFLKKPAVIQGYITGADQERLVTNSMDIMVNDLVEADPTSIVWNNIYPNASADINTITVAKSVYNAASPSAPILTQVQYAYVPTGNGTVGSLTRSINGSVTTLIRGILPPTTSGPLVQVDGSTNNVLIVTINYQPGATPLSITRRVGIKGIGQYAPS